MNAIACNVRVSHAETVQVLDENLPVGLAAVDCDGTEDSLLDCAFDNARARFCAAGGFARAASSAKGINATDGTVLACADAAAGAILDLCDRDLLPLCACSASQPTTSLEYVVQKFSAFR